jgi:predicted CoA-substrate-specific enzyme activase
MTKGVVFDGTQITDCQMLPTGMNPTASVQELCARLHTETADIVVATGYGRALLPDAEKITEITCHGAGAAYLSPGCDAVLDIGGQDCKIIALDRDGCITDFLMNYKCAAGTGRFLDMTMTRVGSEIGKLDAFVKTGTPCAINSMCAVFAESEIVGLLAQGTPSQDIVLGCVHSICRRTAIFAQRLTHADASIFFSGGLAQSDCVRETLQQYLTPAQVSAHPMAQYTGAIGAAVLGYRKHRRKAKWN